MQFKVTSIVPSEKITEKSEKGYSISRRTPYIVTVEAAKDRVRAVFSVEIGFHRYKQKRERHKTLKELQEASEGEIKRFCQEALH